MLSQVLKGAFARRAALGCAGIGGAFAVGNVFSAQAGHPPSYSSKLNT